MYKRLLSLILNIGLSLKCFRENLVIEGNTTEHPKTKEQINIV